MEFRDKDGSLYWMAATAAVVASCRKEMVGFTHGHGQVGAAAAAALLFWASRHGSKTSGVPVSGSGRIGTMELTLGRRTRREHGSANGQKCSSWLCLVLRKIFKIFH